jgi:hypothetical protein
MPQICGMKPGAALIIGIQVVTQKEAAETSRLAPLPMSIIRAICAIDPTDLLAFPGRFRIPHAVLARVGDAALHFARAGLPEEREMPSSSFDHQL